jgi:6-phosphogluconolactonase
MVIVYPDHLSFVDGAAAFIAGIAVESIAARGRFTIALAGGNTPRPVYARLAAADHAGRIAWAKVHVFFSDERCVAPDDPASNCRMARKALLDHVPLPFANVHRMHGEADPAFAALAYEQELRVFLDPSSPPVFDLICLGMGADGHTASLFPGTAALHERERSVVAQYVTALESWRLTFTVTLINVARRIAFLVEGADKSETLRRVLEGPNQPDVLPAQLVRPVSGQVHWLVDAAAATRIQST